MLILIVARGPDKGHIYELFDDRPIVVGREGDGVLLRDGKASRRHAEMWCEGGQWYIKDLKSRRGTFCNGEALTGTTALQDGDRLRVGATELVLARMAVEQVERAHLLGDPAGREVTVDGEARRPGRMLVGLGALAAAVVIGLNVWMLISSNRQAEQWRAQWQASEAQVMASARPMSQTTAAEQRATAEGTSEEILKQVLAEVQAQREQQAAAGEADGEVLSTIVAKLDAQAGQWMTLAEVREAVRQQQMANEPVLEELRLVSEAARANQQTINDVLGQLRSGENQDRQTLGQLAALRAAIEEQAQAAQRSLEMALAGTATKADSAAMLAGLEEVKKALPGDPGYPGDPGDGEILRALLARAQQTATSREVAAALETARAAQPQRLEELIALVAAVTKQVEAQPTAEEVRGLLEWREAHQDERVLAKLTELALQWQVDAEIRQEEMVQRVKEEVGKLAVGETGDAAGMLEKVLAAVEARGAAEAKLAEIDQTIKGWPERTQALLEQVVAATRARDRADSEELLKQVVGEMRSQTLASADELRATIRSELHQLPGDYARGNGQMADAAVSAAALGELAGAGVGAGAGMGAGGQETAGSQAEAGTEAGAGAGGGDMMMGGEPRLTKRELAYKHAYETGEAVVLGGVVDPQTGQVSHGVTLDPQAAMAAGIRSWREWYLLDDFAERMRLQKLANEHMDRGMPLPIMLPPTTARPTGQDAAAQ